MATLRQIQSNRRNAQRSTGATSEAGRAASAANGRTHGLSGSTCLREDERSLVEARLAELERELEPEGAQQREQVFIIAAAAVRVERCELDEEAWRNSRVIRAEFGWDLDRQVESVELAQKIHLRPALIAKKLRQSLAGTEWLRQEFWVLGELQRKAAVDGVLAPLDEAGRSRACDLLGISAPARLVATPLDLPPGHRSGSEDETKRALGEHQAALFATQIETLIELGVGLLEIDASDRADAEAGFGPGIDRMTRLIRRYESEALRRSANAKVELRRLKELAAARKKEAYDRRFRNGASTRELTPERQEALTRALKRLDALEAEPPPREEPPVEPVRAKAATAEAATARPSVFGAVEEALAETATLGDPTALPIFASLPLSRRARKAAARAAHHASRESRD